MITECNITKERLKKATKILMKSKHFEKITVKDIITEAGLSRPIFYKYYKDKYDIVNNIYMDDITPIIEEYYEDYDFRKVFLSSFRLFKDNRTIYKHLLENTDTQNSLYKFWIDNYRNFMIQRIGKKNITNQLSISIDIFCYGTSNIMMNWLKSNSVISDNEMTEFIMNSVPLLLQPYFS